MLNIYQDSRGFIWVCTRGGLSRYDGSRFTNFTTDNGLTNDMINDIYEVAPQEFIIAQNLNGPRLLKNDRIVPLSGGDNITLNKFYKIKNRLVATTDRDGVVEWSKSAFNQIIPSYPNSIGEMAAINDSLWLMVHLPFSIRFTRLSQGKLDDSFPLDATATFTDSHQRTWVGTVHGLKLLDKRNTSNKTLHFLPLPGGFNLPLLNQAYIDQIMEDSRGNIWIGTVNGLVRVDIKGHSYVYTQQNGLPASKVNCMMEDSENNLWIGTPLGLSKLSLTNIMNTYQLDLGPSHDGTLGVQTVSANHWRIFDGKKISQFDPVTGRLSNSIMMNPAGYLINNMNKDEFNVQNMGKALIYHTGRERAENVKWPQKQLGNIIRMDSTTFLGTVVDTIFTIINGEITGYFVTKVKSQIDRLLLDRNNILWVATWDHGLLKVRMGNKSYAGLFQIIDTIAGRLPDPNIRSIYLDNKNILWIGTRYKGLLRYNELPGGKYDIQHYGTKEGLSSNFVLTISQDPAGNIWAGSLQGIDKLIPTGDNYRIFNFGQVNKIFSKIYDIKFHDGNYLQATGYPYLLYAIDKRQDTLPPPLTYITKIAAGPVDTSFTTTSTLHLPTNKAQIYFEFSAPQYINEDFTKYSYRLLGYGDTSWKLSGKSRNVYFASLKPGAYTFEIRALGFNDQWGIPASYEFVVNTPFWQKAWFMALMVVLTGLLAYSIYRYRVRQLIHVQKVRNRIASDVHDEIGSNLTNINILSTLGKRNLAQPQKAGDFLNRISDEVSSSSQALDDIIWSVNTSHDTLEETVARMRRYAAELFDAANISYELYLDPAFEARRIDMEQRRDLYLLYKEAVNNISKHANAKQVAIQLAIERNQLMLIVKDDGIGFDMQKGTERHGLEGMKERIKKWKGKINLESKPGNGTIVQVWLPLAK